MEHKITPLRLSRIQEAKDLGYNPDFSKLSTKGIYKIIKDHYLGINSTQVEESPVEHPLEQQVEESPVEQHKNPHNIVTLRCVKVGSKLRIRFHSFENIDGKIFSGAYNNSYNCRFPKDIRKEGYLYEIPDTDIHLTGGSNMSCFYTVKKGHIKVIKPELTQAQKDIKIFEISECIICMDAKPSLAFIPCGHVCTCNGCSSKMGRHNMQNCPLCRRKIENSFEITE